MAEYIEREKVLFAIGSQALFSQKFWNSNGLHMAEMIVARIPVADVKPVVHGHWMELPDGFYRCSVCQKLDTISSHLNYCSSCGAKMDL